MGGLKAPIMESIGTCDLMYGWEMLAVVEACPEHGCERFDLISKHNNQRHFAICPTCWRLSKRADAKRFREENKVDKCVYYVATDDTEGEEEVFLRLWSYKADEAIDRFWAVRGMTDEMAKAKFKGAGRLAWSIEKLSETRRINGLPQVRMQVKMS